MHIGAAPVRAGARSPPSGSGRASRIQAPQGGIAQDSSRQEPGFTMTMQRNGNAVHELDLIRAATEDVAAARLLLEQRLATLDAITRAAAAHGVPAADIAAAENPAPTPPRGPGTGRPATKRV